MTERPRQTPENQPVPHSEFKATLERLWQQGNFVCVGLDSDWSKIPAGFKQLGREEGTLKFNKEINV